MSINPSYPHGLGSHQIVKGQWFITVIVLDDDVVETVFNEDAIVTARVAIRLREGIFILVEERGGFRFPGHKKSESRVLYAF